MWVQLLVDVRLSERYVIFQIYQMVLVQKVIHFRVHALHYVILNVVLGVRIHLVYALLHVLVKVPGDNTVDVVGMVNRGQLQPASIEGFQEVHYFYPSLEMHTHVLEDIVPIFLQYEVHHLFIRFLRFLLVGDQPSIFDIPPAEDNDETFVVDFGMNVVSLLPFKIE
jgi:hypothetical protein